MPFAVRGGAELRPDLTPLHRPVPAWVEDDGPATLLRIDRDLPAMLANKRDRLAADRNRWTATAPDPVPPWWAEAGRALAASVAADVPSLVHLDGDVVELRAAGLRVHLDGRIAEVEPGPDAPVHLDPVEVVARLEQVPSHLRVLEAVASTVAEDLVLVDRDGHCPWLHVCAPSGWAPGAAGGASLATLHAPVPASDRVLRASRNLAVAMATAGLFVRWNWGIDAAARWARHPDDPPAAWPDDPAAWIFRPERQTTWPLRGLEVGVFAIRVHLARLDEVVDGPRARRLASAVRELPDDLAAYKGLGDGRRDQLTTWLDARASIDDAG